MRETSYNYIEERTNTKDKRLGHENESVNGVSLLKKAKKLEKEEKKKNIYYATGATVLVVGVGLFLAL